MIRYQNISLCQINVKQGQTEYYLPKNANWRDKRIEKIVIYAPDSVSMTSPVDGQTVLQKTDLSELYFDLYNEQGENVMHNIHAYQLLDINNYPPAIGQKLNFDLCRIFFTSAPVSDSALMLYIFYNSTETLVDEATENVTVRFSLPAATKISFTDIIERYMYARSKGVRSIAIWNGRQTYGYNTGYVTLRDITGKMAHENIPTYFFRPINTPAGSDPILTRRIPLDAVELDFNNSFIYNSNPTTEDYIITFYY